MAEGFEPFEGNEVGESFGEIDDFDSNVYEELNQKTELQARLKNIDRGEMSQEQIDERNNLKKEFNRLTESIRAEKSKVVRSIISILHREYVKLKESGRVEVRDIQASQKLFVRIEFNDGDVLFKNERGEKKTLLKNNGEWRTAKSYASILGSKFLRDLGFDPKSSKSANKVASREAANLNKTLNAIDTSNIQSTSGQKALEMLGNISGKVNDTIERIEQETSFIDASEREQLLPLRELKGLDKQLRTISGSLKVSVAKSVELQERIRKENQKLAEVEDDPDISDETRQRIRDRIRDLSGQLEARQEEITVLKDKFSNQMVQIKESIVKFLDKETGSLAERIRTLFREQGVTIVSILTAIGMAIGVLVEALLPSGAASSGGGSTPKGKEGAKEWMKNKLKALANLLSKLAQKAGAALPGILGSIVSWILNRAKEAVGWLSQNLWALITGVGVLIYTYLVTSNGKRRR